MLAIYKKEFKSYFTSMMGYVFVAFVTLVVGIYFIALNLGYSYPIIGYSLASVTFMFLIIVPILTMRVLSEEQKNKTDQLLLTSPISVFNIVTGKYIALLSVFLIPILLICIYPIIMVQYGTVNFSMSYLAIFGFFLLGAAYISIGLFVSSLTENQIISAVVCFGVLLISYLITGITTFISNTPKTSFIGFSILLFLLSIGYYVMTKNMLAGGFAFVIGEIVLVILYVANNSLFEGAISKALNQIDLVGASANMIQNGILDITDIIYYLSIIGFFLFLTVQSIEKRRWS